MRWKDGERGREAVTVGKRRKREGRAHSVKWALKLVKQKHLH